MWSRSSTPAMFEIEDLKVHEGSNPPTFLRSKTAGFGIPTKKRVDSKSESVPVDSKSESATGDSSRPSTSPALAPPEVHIDLAAQQQHEDEADSMDIDQQPLEAHLLKNDDLVTCRMA